MTTTTTTKRYGLRYTHEYTLKGFVPVDPEADTHWLYKGSRYSSKKGWLEWKLTTRATDALSWATPEGAAGYLAKHLTFGGESSFAIDVLPV